MANKTARHFYTRHWRNNKRHGIAAAIIATLYRSRRRALISLFGTGYSTWRAGIMNVTPPRRIAMYGNNACCYSAPVAGDITPIIWHHRFFVVIMFRISAYAIYIFAPAS